MPPALYLQKGFLRAHDHDFQSAYFRFEEAFLGFTNANDAWCKRLTAMKNMLLSKIMLEHAREVPSYFKSTSIFACT